MILRRNSRQFQLEGEDQITDVLAIGGPAICEIDGEQFLVDPQNGKVFELVEVDGIEIEDDFDFGDAEEFDDDDDDDDDEGDDDEGDDDEDEE